MEQEFRRLWNGCGRRLTCFDNPKDRAWKIIFVMIKTSSMLSLCCDKVTYSANFEQRKT